MESNTHASTRSTPQTPAPRDRVNELARAAASLVREEFGPDARVVWFGSWPRGTARRNSDIDVAILPPKPATPADWGRLRGRIEDLRTLYSFDLVDMTAASSDLLAEIERDGIPL